MQARRLYLASKQLIEELTFCPLFSVASQPRWYDLCKDPGKQRNNDCESSISDDPDGVYRVFGWATCFTVFSVRDNSRHCYICEWKSSPIHFAFVADSLSDRGREYFDIPVVWTRRLYVVSIARTPVIAIRNLRENCTSAALRTNVGNHQVAR